LNFEELKEILGSYNENVEIAVMYQNGIDEKMVIEFKEYISFLKMYTLQNGVVKSK